MFFVAFGGGRSRGNSRCACGGRFVRAWVAVPVSSGPFAGLPRALARSGPQTPAPVPVALRGSPGPAPRPLTAARDVRRSPFIIPGASLLIGPPRAGRGPGATSRQRGETISRQRRGGPGRSLSLLLPPPAAPIPAAPRLSPSRAAARPIPAAG